ncbi:MAG: ABC transporter substrate-binding protein [candidate division Zixibacteria bacterium]|jgi:branched-chain amino acid transport system substrate-binding protein|nr:ABC transporter substrate-binding protein [candidate division Zixibacteria bacterium]
MKKLIEFITVGFIGAFLLLSIFVAPSPAAEDVFKFVSIAPLSGAAAGWGIPANRSYQYIFDDYMKKGGLLVGGKHYKFELILYDNKYQTSETMTLLNKAIFGDKVKFLSVMGQHNCVVAAPICETNKIIHLAFASGGEELTNPKFSFTYRMMNSNSIGPILYYPELMKQFGVKTIALVNPDDEGGYTTAKVDKRVAGMLDPSPNIIAEEYYVRGTQDFTPVILRVMPKKPDLIDMGISSPGDTGLFLKQLGEAGYTGLTMNSASIVTTDVVWKAAGKYAKGHFVIGAFADPPTPEYEAFTKRYLKDFGGTAVPILAYDGYESVKALLLAIEKVNTFDSTIVNETLGNLSWTSLFGPARWMGKEKILGYGINRSMCHPYPMSRIGEGGKIEKWMFKSLPLGK